MLKKRIALLLCMALVFTTVLSFPAASFAGIAADDLTTVREVTYGFHTGSETNFYSEDLFRTDGYDYNVRLAMMSLDLTARSCYSFHYNEGEDRYAIMSRNLLEYLQDNGFVDVEANNDYKVKPTEETAPVAFAHKKITDKGKDYTLLVIEPKGGAVELEWVTPEKANLGEGDTGDFAGYLVQKEKTLDYARQYINKYGISGDIKVWMSGMSRTAGVLNLLAADLVDDPQAALGSGIRLKPNDLYCYNFGTLCVASPSKDYTNSRYNCIHNFVEDDDFIAPLPGEPLGFGRYGVVHSFKEGADKDRMLEFLKMKDPSLYESFMKSGDPDRFTPLVIDTKALLKGELNITRDEESYLPYDQASYFDSILLHMAKVFKDSGLDARDGYYKDYQEALEAFMTCYSQSGISFEGMSMSKAVGPSTIAMYLSFIIYKADSDKADNISEAISSTFNALAFLMEDENGNINSQYKKIGKAYTALRDAFFKENKDVQAAPENATIEDAPQKYSLRYEIKPNSLRLKRLKKLSGKLFAAVCKDLYADSGVDQAVIDKLSSDKNSEGVAFFMANLFFGNASQSKGVQRFSLTNEYFKQFITFVGNAGRLRTDHEPPNQTAWLRTLDPYYDDYQMPNAAQSTGYRRVYIDQPAGTDVTGNVKDADGNTVASFKNDTLLSRTDEWIGITSCDSGSWLRLPLDKDYKLSFKLSKDASVNLKVADYSVDDGKVMRTVRNDNDYNWTGFAAKAADQYTLNIPAASSDNGQYELTSAYYSLDITKGSDDADKGMPEIYRSSIPKVKSLKLKSSGNSMTVSWKKLSAAKRKKFGKTEIQYSTDRSFIKNKTVRKEVSKNRKTLKIKKLSKGKTYYVRVRNIKYKYDKKYVGKWSAVKKVKIK